MKNLLFATVAVCVSTAAMAQMSVTVIAPAGVQQNPAGGFPLNGDFWTGDRVNGIVHYKRNPDTTYSVDLRGEISQIDRILAADLAIIQ